MTATDQTRADRKAIERYLRMLETAGDRRFKTKAAVEAAQAKMPERIRAATSMVKRLLLTQEAIELDRLAQALAQEPTIVADFIDALPRFVELNGISIGALRECGVPTTVLKAAGIVADGESAPAPATAAAAGNGSSRPQTAKLTLDYLRTNGPVTDESGSATTVLAGAIGCDAKSVASTLQRLDRQGQVLREVKGKRTYKIEILTPA